MKELSNIKKYKESVAEISRRFPIQEKYKLFIIVMHMQAIDNYYYVMHVN